MQSKVVVIGLGKSGIASARLLARKGYTVFVSDIKEDDVTKNAVDTLIKEGLIDRDHFELGCHTERFIKMADMVVLSPGVPADSLPVRFAKDRGISIIGELELGYRNCPARIIAVTGTSGKTTVTTLIGRMLERSGMDVVVCGNIGNPLTGEIDKIGRDSIVVLEVSSFQLEWIEHFRPKVSIILNISDNHLDRHRDMDEYVSLKMKIFSNQDRGDVVFLNGKDDIVRGLSKKIKGPRVEFFDEYKNYRQRFGIENDDYLAAVSVASNEGVDDKTMLSVISEFRGIEHRLEYVSTIQGVDFINDSKSTTVASVDWALKSISGEIVLIMGGRYKGGDFSRLKDLILQKVRCVVSIGEASPIIKKSLGSFIEVIEMPSLEEAVYLAFDRAKGCIKKDGKVLFSPGCSSFDMFKDYQERGRIFKEVCYGLVESTRCA